MPCHSALLGLDLSNWTFLAQCPLKDFTKRINIGLDPVELHAIEYTELNKVLLDTYIAHQV